MNDSVLIQISADYKAAFVKHPKVISSRRNYGCLIDKRLVSSWLAVKLQISTTSEKETGCCFLVINPATHYINSLQSVHGGFSGAPADMKTRKFT